MNHSLGPLLLDPSLDPVALTLADSHNHRRLDDRQLSSKHSLDYLYPLLVLHRQGCHPNTLT